MISDNLIIQAKTIRQRKGEITPHFSICPVHYPEIHQTCLNPTYLDKGYYRHHNGEFYYTDREHADLRVMECDICHNEIYLLNTGQQNWDALKEETTIPKRHRYINEQ